VVKVSSKIKPKKLAILCVSAQEVSTNFFQYLIIKYRTYCLHIFYKTWKTNTMHEYNNNIQLLFYCIFFFVSVNDDIFKIYHSIWTLFPIIIVFIVRIFLSLVICLFYLIVRLIQKYYMKQLTLKIYIVLPMFN